MKLVQDSSELATNLNERWIVLTGDGTSESNVIKSLCKIFNGERKQLCFAELPHSFKQRTTINAFNFIRQSKERFFLCLLDKEHIRIDAKDEIGKHLQKKIKMTIEKIENVNDVILVEGKIGSRAIIILCVIFGSRKCIEEEIAHLIDLEFGVKIQLPEGEVSSKSLKRDIKRFLRERKLRIEELISEAAKENLEKALPNICIALQNIEARIVLQ